MADDEGDIRSSFRLVIDSQPDMHLVGEAIEGSAALDTVRHLVPDVVLMGSPDATTDGPEITRILRRTSGPSAFKVIVVTLRPRRVRLGSIGDRCLRVPIEPAGLEQRSGDVVGQVAEPEGGAAQVLDSAF